SYPPGMATPGHGTGKKDEGTARLDTLGSMGGAPISGNSYLCASMRRTGRIRRSSKGKRLKWPSVEEVVPVRIVVRPGSGRRLGREELERRRRPVAPKVPLLVP